MPSRRPFLPMGIQYGCAAGAAVLSILLFIGAVSAVSVLVTPEKDGTLTVSGQVNGNLSSQVALWIVGPGYSGQTFVPVRDDGHFTVNTAQQGIPPFSPGTYSIYAEDQGGDGLFDVGYDNTTGMIVKTRTREHLVPLTGKNTGSAAEVATALGRALLSQIVDDQLATASTQVGVYGTIPSTVPPGTITGSITVKVSSERIAPGEDVTVYGTAPGTSGEVALWVIGPDSFEVSTTPVRQDRSYSLVIPSGKTSSLQQGEYSVFVVDPGKNNRPDILHDSGSGAVLRSNNNKVLFSSKGEGKLTGITAADVLVEAFNDPAIDDVYTRLRFMITPPGTPATTREQGTDVPATTTKVPVLPTTKAADLSPVPVILVLCLACACLASGKNGR